MSRQFIRGLLVAIAFGGAVANADIAWSNTIDPAGSRSYATRAEFDQAFADAAAASRRGNTPANREKLRNAGWKYLNTPVASK